jgi:hypothetical protein
VKADKSLKVDEMGFGEVIGMEKRFRWRSGLVWEEIWIEKCFCCQRRCWETRKVLKALSKLLMFRLPWNHCCVDKHRLYANLIQIKSKQHANGCASTVESRYVLCYLLHNLSTKSSLVYCFLSSKICQVPCFLTSMISWQDSQEFATNWQRFSKCKSLSPKDKVSWFFAI